LLVRLFGLLEDRLLGCGLAVGAGLTAQKALPHAVSDIAALCKAAMSILPISIIVFMMRFAFSASGSANRVKGLASRGESGLEPINR
jgi:hypothetical protein